MSVRKEWSKQEINHVQECIGFHKIATIAKRLDRSYESVAVKIKRLGLSNTKFQTGFVTIGELAKILKVDRNIIKEWMKRHDLPYIKRATRKSKSFYFINTEDFWNWAKANKEKVQFSNIDPQVLLPEPDWVETERKFEREQQIIKKRRYNPWTTGEDQKLLKLRSKGFTFSEIGKELNRSPNSVSHRFHRINTADHYTDK
jgi:hypothetical protein